MRLIVGLGNPGPEYEWTKHNLGFLFIDGLANSLKATWKDKPKLKSKIAEVNYNGEKVILVKPQTFMNLSGQAVVDNISWYKIKSEQLIVIHDDLDLEKGVLRIRPEGSAGGHNGMASIIQLLGTDKFMRMRLGIGRPAQKDEGSVVKYVLSKIDKSDRSSFIDLIKKAEEALLFYLQNDLASTMNKYNQ